MIKIIAKALLTIGVGFLDYRVVVGTTDRAHEFEGQLPTMSDWLTPGLLAICFSIIFALFAYRFLSGARGWGWFLAVNIALILVSVFAYSPVPGA
jgi:hypothetical protein